MVIVQGDKVTARDGDEIYVGEFAGRVGTVTGTHREWGGIVARVRFPDGQESTFYADGLRRATAKQLRASEAQPAPQSSFTNSHGDEAK